MSFIPKSDLEIHYLAIGEIRSNPHNARQHHARQISQLASSIKKFGFTCPVIINGEGELLCGHARVAAAEQAGLSTIPAIRLAHLSKTDQRALMIADNKLAENATWDQKMLRTELRILLETDIDFNFSAIGFETAEVDVLIDDEISEDETAGEHATSAAMPAVAKDQLSIAQPGDTWNLGEHNIYCGDAIFGTESSCCRSRHV